MARKNKKKAIERLQKALSEIPALKKMPHTSQKFKKWHRNTRVTIAHSFGSESKHVKDFDDIGYSLMAFTNATPEPKFQAAYVRGLETTASTLESMVDEIKEYWEEDEQSPSVSNTKAKTQNLTNKVFVIHGRDVAARQTVTRFLERLGIEPVILHEQPNKGRTIIEKFEDYANVAFAVVLLTPDDVGKLKDDGASELQPRARQNVILELGFFLGALGRQRVCPLVKGNVETPSDYDGVVYTELDDAEGWQLKLVRELKSAGFNVDANRAL